MKKMRRNYNRFWYSSSWSCRKECQILCKKIKAKKKDSKLKDMISLVMIKDKI